jgi:hypothetical protein
MLSSPQTLLQDPLGKICVQFGDWVCSGSLEEVENMKIL